LPSRSGSGTGAPAAAVRQAALSSELLTELFGLSWPNAPHRVIPNAATRRWLSAGERGPEWIRVANRVSRPLALRLPDALTIACTVTDDGLPLGASLVGTWTRLSGPAAVTFSGVSPPLRISGRSPR